MFHNFPISVPKEHFSTERSVKNRPYPFLFGSFSFFHRKARLFLPTVRKIRSVRFVLLQNSLYPDQVEVLRTLRKQGSASLAGLKLIDIHILQHTLQIETFHLPNNV